MTVHHIIREDDQKRNCPYCGRNTSSLKWESVFHSNSLYKEHKCSCGKKVTVKMPFMGSGHDSWSNDLDRRVDDLEDDSGSQKR